MQAPDFWEYGEGYLESLLLSPLSFLYGKITTKRACKPASWKAPVPVVCIGNLIMGGAGKTPTAIAIAKFLKKQGKSPFFLSRGYGGSLEGPVIVSNHPSHKVGDEPLLLSQTAPVCVSKDRIAGAKLCIEKGADIIIMDDGFQNPYLHKDISILVIDGGYGHGNERVFPAGPLREPIKEGLKRAHGVVVIGEDKTDTISKIKKFAPALPILRASIVPEKWDNSKQTDVVAFAGIGRPEKFYNTLKNMGLTVHEKHDFTDHHPFTAEDVEMLQKSALMHNARLITTEKDWVRLPQKGMHNIKVVKISLAWQGEGMLKPVFNSVLS